MKIVSVIMFVVLFVAFAATSTKAETEVVYIYSFQHNEMTVGGRVGKAIDDSIAWTETAAAEVADWTVNVATDVADWTVGAADWTVNAVNDISDWTMNAWNSATEWIGGIF